MSTLSLHKLHVLIVDDFENFRSTLCKMLMDIGIGNVDSAHNGEDALRYCRSRPYDIILCDYNLGTGKTGQHVLEDLRIGKTLCTESIFILVSAETSRSIVMAAYDFEPDAYLTKPINGKALEQRLLRLLAQRQATLPILKALKAKNFPELELLCRKEIAAGGRYASFCQKTLGEMYLSTNQLPKAATLFREVLDVRELEWAQLGMAKVKVKSSDYIAAQQWIAEILQANPLSMKAYDLQASIHAATNSNIELQHCLQQAVEISPLSILRQQTLGEVAKTNRDYLVAANALKKAVKLGENSSYDKADIHVQLSQVVVDLHAYDKDAAKPFLRDALKSVVGFDENFGGGTSQSLQSLFLASQLYACLDDEARAKNTFQQAEALLQQFNGDKLLVEMERLRTLKVLGRDDEANRDLAELSIKYSTDQKALEVIDTMQDEPKSEKNKKMVAEINKKGIALYNSQQFLLAAKSFNAALQVLPNHVGLHLNAAQALLDHVKISFDEKIAIQTGEVLAKIEAILTLRHPQFARYKQLKDSYEILMQEHGTYL
jgi:DNA-binding response OmpR family regulator